MNVHLVDGTYELFRHYFAMPSRLDAEGREVGALTGVLGSVMDMLRDGVTHVGVATDHVIESFRNELWPGYKTGAGIEPDLLQQFHPLEDALRAMGVTVWPMVEGEADDGLASAAKAAADETRVERVVICTPDKDLSQCVVGERVIQLDRRSGIVRTATGVRDKFGVDPESIPDYLALMGDSADGFPGLKGWGAKSAGTLLGRYPHLEDIPTDTGQWEVAVRGAQRLSATLREGWEDAILFRRLATLRDDIELFDGVDQLRWQGPKQEFASLAAHLGRPGLAEAVRSLASHR